MKGENMDIKAHAFLLILATMVLIDMVIVAGRPLNSWYRRFFDGPET